MFTAVLPADNDPAARSVNVLREDREGAIWCGTNKGVYRLERTGGQLGNGATRTAGGGPWLEPMEFGMPRQYAMQSFVTAIAEDRGGALWVATYSGLYRRGADGRTARYTERDGLPAPFDTLHDLLVDHRGRLWAATRHGGFFQIDPVVLEPQKAALHVVGTLTPDQGLPTPWVFCLFETSQRQFWIGTNQGLIEFLPDSDDPVRRFRSYSTEQGLSFREVTALTEDASGNLWLGTNSAGAMKLARNGLTTYGAPDGVGAVKAIFEDRTGSLCVRGEALGAGAPTEEYGRFDGRRITWFKPQAIWNLGWVGEQVTLQARNGEWWLGTGEGVYRFGPAPNFDAVHTSRPLARYAKQEGLAGSQVYRLFEDSRGDVWASTLLAPLGRPPSRGLARWNRPGGRWTDLSDLVLRSDLPISFGEDANGRVWMGFLTGLVRSAGDVFRRFGVDDGLPPGAITDIHADRSGRLWLASSRTGLIRVDDAGSEHPVFKTFTTAQGLASNTTDVLAEDSFGRIYVGTGRGLDRLDPRTGRLTHFTTADGLAPGTFRAAFRDHTGALWFGLTGGMSRLVPAPDPPAAPPPILVNGLVVAGTPHRISAIGERDMVLNDLEPGRNQVQIDFVGLAFAPGEALRYQYRLEGAARDWSPPTEQRSITYANLAPGRYRFLVRAVSADGTPSATPATVTFTVLRPIWARWWFVLLAAAAAAAAGRAVYRARMTRIFELANVRARIAADLHDDIGANLTKIAILSEVAQQRAATHSDADGHDTVHLGAAPSEAADRDAALASSPLSSIARISRESVAAMSDIVWAINPQRDQLVDLVRRMRQHAEEVFTTYGVKLTFRAPGDGEDVKLGPDVRRDVYLIFKEAVNNVARHSRCTEVGIEIRFDRSSLSLDVVDDGIGFNAHGSYDGQGLTSMRRRAEHLGGACEVWSTREGTRIRVRIPIGSRRTFGGNRLKDPTSIRRSSTA